MDKESHVYKVKGLKDNYELITFEFIKEDKSKIILKEYKWQKI